MRKTRNNSANGPTHRDPEAATEAATEAAAAVAAETETATAAPKTNKSQQLHAQQSEAQQSEAQQQEARLQANALELLLRSPRLNIDTILRLLDIDEREFRALVKVHPALGGLLKQRSQGLLELPGTKPRKCPMCREWFLPYAGDRLCSDECKTANRIDRRDFREESRANAID